SNGDEDEPHSSVVVDGGLVLFVMDGLHALNALTGRLVWARNTSSLATPAAAYGRVFMQTSSGQELLAWKDDGTPLWKVATPAAGLSSVAVANGVVYVGCDDETLRAYAASDGGELWQSRQVGAHVEGSPAVASGM